jgi:hypothetical protein
MRARLFPFTGVTLCRSMSQSLAWPLWLGLFLLGAAQAVQAARPMNTDDANIVDEKACQLETWVKRNKLSNEFWALPGCNFGQDIEWTLGGQRQWNDDAPTGHVHVFQAKKRWVAVEPGRWGISTTLGTGRNTWTDGTDANHSDRYLNVPMTYLSHAGWLAHVNVGGVQHRDIDQANRTFGLGAEVPINDRAYLLAEKFGEQGAPNKYQVGFRIWLVPQRVQLDTTYGNNLAGGDSHTRWFTIGLRLLSQPFLR